MRQLARSVGRDGAPRALAAPRRLAPLDLRHLLRCLPRTWRAPSRHQVSVPASFPHSALSFPHSFRLSILSASLTHCLIVFLARLTLCHAGGRLHSLAHSLGVTRCVHRRGEDSGASVRMFERADSGCVCTETGIVCRLRRWTRCPTQATCTRTALSTWASLCIRRCAVVYAYHTLMLALRTHSLHVESATDISHMPYAALLALDSDPTLQR